MAGVQKTTALIPELIPGKRYRMVLETDGISTNLPSIEFVVPSTPTLLSTYTPTYRVYDDGYYESRWGGTEGIPEQNLSNSITHWTRSKGSATYSFKLNVNVPDSLRVGMTFTVDGISQGSHEYYDRLTYTVTSKSGVQVTAVGGSFSACPSNDHYISWDNGKTGKKRVVDSSDGLATHLDKKAAEKKWGNGTDEYWEYIDGRATGGDGSWKKRSPDIPAALYYTVPAVPSTRRQYDEWVKTKSITVYLPDDIKLYSQRDKSGALVIQDIPVFAYKTGGVIKLLDDNSNLGITPLIISNSSINSYIRNNITSRHINTSESREYIFTILRYIKSGNNWYGTWLQTLYPYNDIAELQNNLNNVIFSKAGISR